MLNSIIKRHNMITPLSETEIKIIKSITAIMPKAIYKPKIFTSFI